MENVERANKRLNTATEKLQSDLNAQLGKLTEKEKTLKERLDDLNAKKTKTAHDNGDVDADGDDLVEINAGGKIVAVKRSTLTQFEGTRLEAIFSGRWDKKIIRDNNDRVFLDVNPTCFQTIVDYLNDLAISSDDNPPSPPSFEAETNDILKHQLELFGIDDKIRIVEFPESNIIKLPTHAIVVEDWMKEVESTGDFKLLYRLSRDGRDDSNFHSKCENKGPTLTVIETTGGKIIGGYTEEPWSKRGESSWLEAEKAFFFSITLNKTKSPFKVKVAKAKGYMDIFCQSEYESEPDVYVNGSSIDVRFGNYYFEALPPERISSARRTIKEMEVFQVTFTKEPETNMLQVPFKELAFSKGVNEAMNDKMDSLQALEAELARLEHGFNDERKFMDVFANGAPEDAMTLNVSGFTMSVAKGTMMILKKSHLATLATKKSKQRSKDSGTKDISEWKHEEVVAWLKGLKGVPESVVAIFEKNKIEGIELVALGKDGMIDLGVTRKPTIFVILEEIKKLQSAGVNNAMLIEHSPYCFEKIIDYLRMMRSYEKGLVKIKPSRPVVRESERARFEKVVKHYFPGDSSKFILGCVDCCS